jgi:hypothetical protein
VRLAAAGAAAVRAPACHLSLFGRLHTQHTSAAGDGGGGGQGAGVCLSCSADCTHNTRQHMRSPPPSPPSSLAQQPKQLALRQEALPCRRQEGVREGGTAKLLSLYLSLLAMTAP